MGREAGLRVASVGGTRMGALWYHLRLGGDKVTTMLKTLLTGFLFLIFICGAGLAQENVSQGNESTDAGSGINKSLAITLDSGETINVTFRGDGRPYGGNRIRITTDGLFIHLVIDDEFMQTSLLDCSNTDDWNSPDRLSIDAQSFMERMFVLYTGPMPPEPVDYSVMSQKYIDLWERTLNVFESFENNAQFKDFIMESAPDIVDRIYHAINGINAGLFMPTYGSYLPEDFLPEDVELDVGIAYRVGSTLFSLMDDPGRPYRITEMSGDHSFSLNSAMPAWDPKQEVVIESTELMMTGIRKLVINPEYETMKVVVSGENVPELQGLYAELQQLLCKSMGFTDEMPQDYSSDDFGVDDMIENEAERERLRAEVDMNEIFEEVDRVEGEIDRVRAELAQRMTLDSWLSEAGMTDKWAETVDSISATLVKLESELPQFDEGWLQEENFDIGVQIPITLTGLNSYEPGIEIAPSDIAALMDALRASMEEKE